MLPDFELITHKFPERKDIRIYAIADVHFGAREHLEREWSMFCANFLKDEDAYLILAGDLINNGLKNSVTNVYEETVRPRDQKRIMTEMLTPLKDRILAATHGAGGGALTGGAVNKAERFGYVIDGIDALIVGHTHKPFVTDPVKIKVDASHKKIYFAPFRVISVSSWLAYGGYPVRKMLSPTANTRQIITLSGTKKEIRVETY